MKFRIRLLHSFLALASLTTPFHAGAQPVCSQPAFAEFPGSPVALGNTPTTVVALHANQDGFADLAWPVAPDRVHPDPTPIWLALSDGKGGYEAPVEIAELPYTTVLAARDVNNDTFEDLLIFPSSDRMQTALGDGAGGFSLIDASTSSASSYSPPYFSDLNDDELVDLIVPEFSQGWGTYAGNGDGTFQRIGSVRPLTFTGNEAGVGDVNGDGIDDFGFPNSFEMALRYSEAGQRFAQITSFAVAASDPVDSSIYGIVAGNFNGDEHLDFAGVSRNYVHVWLGDGAVGFSAFSYPVANPVLSEIRGADLTGDGLTDLLLRDHETHQWFAMATQPGGSFSGVLTPVAPAAQGSLVDLRDIDGDGRSDVVLWRYGSDQVQLLRSTCPLALTSSALPNPGFSGEAIEYQFGIENVSDQGTAALDWSLSAPPEIMILSATPTTGACSTPTSCALGSLAPGQSAQIAVSAAVAAGFYGFTGPTATLAGAGVGPFEWRARHWAASRVVPEV